MPHQLTFCGAGFHEKQATLESYEALAACERVLLWHLPEEIAAEFRRRLPQAEDLTPELRRGGDEAGLATVARALADVERVGVVFSGHPLLYTPAAALIRRCRAERLDYRIVSAVSSPDFTLSLVERLLDADELELFSRGYNVRDAEDAASGRAALDAGYSTIILKAGGMSEPRAGALAKALSETHGAKTAVFLVRGGGEPRAPGNCERARVGDLGKLLAKAHSAVTLFVPARLPEAA